MFRVSSRSMVPGTQLIRMETGVFLAIDIRLCILRNNLCFMMASFWSLVSHEHERQLAKRMNKAKHDNPSPFSGIGLFPLLALAGLAPSMVLEAAIAPQDSGHPNVVTFSPEQPDDGVFNQPVLQRVNGQDLIYYEFADATNQRRGIRSRDLDGVLVHEVLLPSYSDNTGFFAVAQDGTIYATEERSGIERIQVYTLSGGVYTEGASIGPDGPGGDNFSNQLLTYGRIAVSPVSGNVFVNPNLRLNAAEPGVLRVYQSDGTFITTIDTNGILAPTLEGGVRDHFLVPGHDGTGELWVRGHYGGGTVTGNRSQWFKVFDENGTFIRLFDVGSTTYGVVKEDLLYTGNDLTMHPLTAESAPGNDIGYIPASISVGDFLGRTSDRRIVGVTGDGDDAVIRVYPYPVFRTFNPDDQNAVPNPIVSLIEQRPGTTILDIDYRIEDADDTTVETAALAFPDGNASVLNALPLVTFADGTESNLGPGMAANTRHRISWNAGNDWNLDFGDISVMILARDSRTYWFDVHLIDIPADGARPAVTISRNPLQEYDFTQQWLWLIATADPSISVIGGLIYGVGGSYDGVQLTDSSGNSTENGRAFLLARDNLRVATPAEVTRAKEGATAGFIVRLDPPSRLYTTGRPNNPLPYEINEYGVESRTFVTGGWDYGAGSANLWHVVPISAP